MAGLYSLLRPLLFQLEPETAHRLTLGAIGLLGRIHPINQYLADAWRGSLPAIPVEAMGLVFQPGRPCGGTGQACTSR